MRFTFCAQLSIIPLWRCKLVHMQTLLMSACAGGTDGNSKLIVNEWAQNEVRKRKKKHHENEEKEIVTVAAENKKIVM